ncbi:winged helix-turn-helix transcriptional regulator [bacterium]|nr:winged helix-turn-helix transcriptional regulator [bacterium]
MLESLIGSTNRERILLYLVFRNEGYAREISRYFDTDLSQIQKQLERLENGGILYSRSAGKTILYGLNPRYPFKKELEILFKKLFTFLPKTDRISLTMNRKRPRRKGKPL